MQILQKKKQNINQQSYHKLSHILPKTQRYVENSYNRDISYKQCLNHISNNTNNNIR